MLKTSIPFVDLRGKTSIDLLRTYPDKARELIKSARRIYGVWSLIASIPALPFANRRSRAWLKRTQNPWFYEIESMEEILELPGVFALNLSYEWGCTTGAYRTGESVSMLRTLDWPYPQLGRHLMVVLQQGKAGEFYNLTWPGLSGVFTGMARGRFSAALNQAPSRRYNLTFMGDWIKNRMRVGRETGLPPAHLLRLVFERAATYEEAKTMLATTPIAIPAIFTLSGTKPGEGCVIERLESVAEIIELSAGLNVTAANHFSSVLASYGKGWRPREIDSAGRLRQSQSIGGHDLEAEDFTWLRAPIINPRTRLAVVMDAATGRLCVQGFEGTVAVTNLFSLSGNSPAKRQGGAWN